MKDDSDAPASRLTERERTILRLVGQLKRSKAIAAELGISESLVNNACSSAARKLGVGDRMSAAQALQRAERRPEEPAVTIHQPPPSIRQLPPTPWERFVALVARLPWPAPTRERPDNDLTPLQLAFATTVALGVLLLCAAAYLVAVSALAAHH